jgi:deferrochelatase/peroxidase EfeB
MDLSRREVLGGAIKLGAVGGAIALGSSTVLAACNRSSDSSSTPKATDIVDYRGAHQAGIVTPAPGRLVYGAFDVTTNRHTDVSALLRSWTDAIALMTQGQALGPIQPTNAQEAPVDTGEATGLPPSNLTVTIGFGRSLFVTDDGDDRFGISGMLPKQLIELPHFSGEQLDATRSGGDLSVQCCADDPQVAFHAYRNLARIARGKAAIRWTQLGFGRTSTTSSSESTPRNLMGFKDGTNNITAEQATALDDFVWVADTDNPAWMRGGSYAVVRRIRMDLEAWDRSAISDQEDTIGRNKLEGAPLGLHHEHDAVDLAKLPVDAHIRVAAPGENGGVRILRRGYSFTDGVDPKTGELDAGLFFIAYQRDPRAQFVVLQRRLGVIDALNEYIVHNASALFAVPPGTGGGGFVGATLFG